MFRYYCLNPIARVGLDRFREGFTETKEIGEAEGILVRSASMHELELSDKLLAVARAGAGVNNIPLDQCAEKESSSSIRREPMPMALRNW